jgi:hypothetical protein
MTTDQRRASLRLSAFPGSRKRCLMSFGWFNGRKRKATNHRAKQAVRPALEALEPRWLPSAVRWLSGFSANIMPGNDDGSSGQVSLGFPAGFAGGNYSSLYVNNNGNVTFTGPLSQYTPTSIHPDMIAPFFADVDTRVGHGIVEYGTDTVDGHAAFGVIWSNVGYYAYHLDKLNTFQVILINRPDLGSTAFDIEFNYDTIKWETGDASAGSGGFGGFPARA